MFESLNGEQQKEFFNLGTVNLNELLRHVTVTSEKYKTDEEYYGAGVTSNPCLCMRRKDIHKVSWTIWRRTREMMTSAGTQYWNA